MNEKTVELAVIGGGVAGLSAALYAARAGIKVAVIDDGVIGGQAAVIDEVANYPGFKPASGYELVKTIKSQASDFGAEFIRDRVIRTELLGKQKKLYCRRNEISARTVIIACGQKKKKAGFEGEEKFIGRGVSYCAACDGAFFEGKRIFVIGAGESAAQEALYLTRFGESVTVLTRRQGLHCSAAAIDALNKSGKVKIKPFSSLIKADGGGFITELTVSDNRDGKTERIADDRGIGVFVFVGATPETDLFAESVKLDGGGYILTDEEMRTNTDGVWAAGDIRAKSLRQLITAASDGAVAASSAVRYLEREE